ncbi:TolC family protein [Roseateles paludis]|uniref:TolC family protein n=1 Tax=Roseateles paludis TaxID=3145238 RepID=A0ABV0FXV8_9BURK
MKRLLFAAWVAVVLPSQAAPSMAEAFEAAWQRSSVSAEASGQQRRAEAERTAAGALWAAPPALTVDQVQNRQGLPGSNTATRETELGVAVPLWLPGQRAARQAQAEAERQAAAANTAAARWALAGSVRELAAELAQLQAELALTEAQAQELGQLAADVQRRVAAGDLARADALAAQAEHLGARSQHAQVQQRLASARQRWLALTGLAEAPDAGDFNPTDTPTPAEHPLLAAASARLQLAHERQAVMRASRSDPPELALRTRRETAPGEPSVRGVGLTLRVPLGTADRREPQQAAALAELELAEALLRETRVRLDTELATARSEQARAREQLAAEQERARLLRERALLIDTSFKAGETPLPERLRAQSSAAQAEAAATRQRAALAAATARLLQAQGVLP